MVTEHSADTKPARRIEVFTGAGRRRTWSAEDKARIVAESVTGGESVCAVARRHGLSPQQLFGWRRQAREPLATRSGAGAPLLVPAVVETSPPERASRRRRRRRPDKIHHISGMIEMEIDGVTVRVGRGADARTVAAVIRALKVGT
jgi:transposase